VDQHIGCRDEGAQFVARFVGLAGYNPFRIKESLAEIELAVTRHGFKGVYVHIYGFDIPLNDAKMYPLFAKCVELDVPVSMQVGHVLEASPSDGARPMLLDRIACDFPDPDRPVRTTNREVTAVRAARRAA